MIEILVEPPRQFLHILLYYILCLKIFRFFFGKQSPTFNYFWKTLVLFEFLDTRDRNFVQYSFCLEKLQWPNSHYKRKANISSVWCIDFFLIFELFWNSLQFLNFLNIWNFRIFLNSLKYFECFEIFFEILEFFEIF